MKKITSYVLVLAGMLAAVACDNNQGLKKTQSGLLYKIIPEGKGETVKRGQFLKLQFVQKLRDSILYNSAEAMPAYVPVDTATPNYSVSEIFGFLRKGDSAIAIQLGDSIEKKSGRPLPPGIKKKDKITLSFRVLDIIATQDLVLADREKEVLKEKERETKRIEDYLAANKINAQKTAEGTFVVVKTPGDGPAVDSGKLISVMYSGKSFPAGKEFETNMAGPHREPIQFVVGRKGGMIEGWDDGLRLFKKGGKGTLYIPAFLAYDEKPGPNKKPYENLIFDVEITDVTDAPAQTERPGMPQSRPVPKKTK